MSYHFHYRQLQCGQPSCPTLLFLHGFLGSHHDFDPILDALAPNFTGLAVDLPGHGQTEVIGEDNLFTMPQTAQAIVHWLDQRAIAVCGVVGYSMGGRLGLYLALHFPDRFPQAMLLSASPGLMTASERQARLQHDWELADQIEADFPTFLDRWYRQPLFASLRHHPQFESWLRRRSQARPTQLAKSLRYLSTGQQPSLWESLSLHRQPLWLLAGDADLKFCQIHQRMAEQCATAHAIVIPHCGHAIHLEQPAQLVQHIQRLMGSEGESC